jgi:hypothetical protein
MASLSRIMLRSSGPHRNIPRVFGAQLRSLHETAEKPVFRWEVCRPACRRLLDSERQPPSIFRTHWILRANCLQRKSQFGMHNFRSKVSHNSKQLSDTARDFCRARTFISTAPQCLIDILLGVSLPTRSRRAPNRGCVAAMNTGDRMEE